MKTLLCSFLLVGLAGVVWSQGCKEKIESVMECMTQGKEGEMALAEFEGMEVEELEQIDPSELEKPDRRAFRKFMKLTALDACFSSNECQSPKDVMECMMDGVDLEPMKTCVSDAVSSMDLPVPDFEGFHGAMMKSMNPLKMMIKVGRMLKKEFGGKVPPFILEKMDKKLDMLCEEGDGDAAKSCIMEVLGVEAMEVPEGLPPFPVGGPGGGPPDFMRKKLPPFMRKAIKCLRQIPKGDKCRREMRKMAGVICCCGKKTGIRDALKAAATDCGVSDTSKIDKIGDTLEGRICKKEVTC